jgi:hypothetical protein
MDLCELKSRQQWRANLMTSKFKDQTESIPPSSSASAIADQGQPSRLSASSDNTPISTQTSNQPLPPMLSTVKSVSEKSRQHAVLLKVLLSSLESAGLIRRYKVLSKDGVWTETQIVFDNTLWDETLELRVLSLLTTVNQEG